jgi:AcrR family transcriptional regulator
MRDNDNSVNIERATDSKDSYHHGDLRAALVRAGVAALDMGTSVDTLSLRALARAVGVSATAVYRHFPDKAALLSALASEALELLAEEQQRAAMVAGPNAMAAFSASGGAYVRFAMAHPALFRLIWATAPDRDLFEMPLDECDNAMAGLRKGIDAIMPAGAAPETRRAAALTCWGLVHGLAMLALDRQILLDDAMIDRVVAGLAGNGLGGLPA